MLYQMTQDGRDVFNRSKDAVTDYLASLIGTSAAELKHAEGSIRYDQFPA